MPKARSKTGIIRTDLADVRLLSEVAAGRIKIKAAGGIRDLASCQQFLAAGAERIGTSAGMRIMQQWWQLTAGDL